MTAAEKLECPLLRCKEQSDNHESMLRHLAACPELASREYWCFDHDRCERFDDYGTCKKCLGHPSRRRRMLSKAKHFFSALGHKSRKSIELDYTLLDDSMLPPSYDSLENMEPPNDKAELSSTEIVEIDSTEVSSPHPVQYVPQAQSVLQVQQVHQVHHMPTPVIDPQDLFLPELDSTMISSDSIMQWQPTPSIIEPMNGHSFSIGMKPCLQVTTHGLEHLPLLPPPPPPPVSSSSRSKNLSPSSSVRSTASTSSTSSTVSTTSMASTNSSLISPASVWSAATVWSGLETRLSSPSLGFVSPGGCLPEDTYADMGPCNDTYPSDFLHDMFELPAEEVPVFELSSDPALFTLDIHPSTDFSCAPKAVSEISDCLKAQPTEVHNSMACYSETKAIVASAWDALQEHILSSLAKVEGLQQNPLAEQLKLFSARTIAFNGLRTLRNILGGEPVISPLDALCLVHVIYSTSLVTYEDDALSWSHKFFAQSLQYSTRFSPEVQNHYKEVVKAIWQPGNMSDAQLSTITREQVRTLHRSGSQKGKEREIGTCESSSDSLIVAARDFLDGKWSILPFVPLRASRCRLLTRLL